MAHSFNLKHLCPSQLFAMVCQLKRKICGHLIGAELAVIELSNVNLSKKPI